MHRRSRTLTSQPVDQVGVSWPLRVVSSLSLEQLVDCNSLEQQRGMLMSVMNRI